MLSMSVKDPGGGCRGHLMEGRLYLLQISYFYNPHLIVTLGRFGLRENTVLSP